MADLYMTTVFFNASQHPLKVLVSEHDAEVIGNCVVNQSTAFNLKALNFKRPNEVLNLFVVNGRNVDFVTTKEHSTGAVV